MRYLRRWIALHLVYLADRVSPDDAFRCTGFGFEFVRNRGVVLNEDGRGCPIWYHGMDDYRRAFGD